MANDRLWCVAVDCARRSPHRTRRLGADGRPSCMGSHGQTGQPPRGGAKTNASRAALMRGRAALSGYRPKTRVFGKGQVKSVKWTPRTPLRCFLRSHRAQATGNRIAASKSFTPASTGCKPLSHAPAATSPKGSTETAGASPVASPVARASGDCGLEMDFKVVLALIDGPSIGAHLPVSELYHLKGTARALVETLAPTRARPPFLGTPELVWALLVLHMALSLTPGQGLRRLTAEGEEQLDAYQACQLAEPNASVRQAAWRLQPRLLNFVYESTAVWPSPYLGSRAGALSTQRWSTE